jgi:acetylglutamate kinase
VSAPPDATERLRLAHERAGVLVEALPYIRRFRGATVVVKYGGNAMTDPSLAARFAEDVVFLHAVGLRPVVVHGGGPQIGELMRRLGMEPEFRDGRRVTDADTLDVARMVLVGKVNRDIVAAINCHGALAVGLSGEDANLITADVLDARLGFVGEVTGVNRAIIDRLLAEDLIPVISTIGTDESGQALNINADTVAGAVAAELQAEKIVYLSDVPGLLRDADDPLSLIPAVTVAELDALVDDGTVAGGMIPKIEACRAAVLAGVRSAHLLDGRIPHVVLLELFTDAGIGTMISAPERRGAEGNP